MRFVLSEKQNGKLYPVVVCGEPIIDPARFPCMSLEDIAKDSADEMEKAWRKQLRKLSSWIQPDTLKKITAADRRILKSLGQERAGIIPDTYWGLRVFCKAYQLQEPEPEIHVSNYDMPILKGIQSGYGEEASELVRTILYAVIGNMEIAVKISCKIPLEPGSGFRNQVILQRGTSVIQEKALVEALCLDYMESHYEQAMQLLTGLLQREHIEYKGQYWIREIQDGMNQAEDVMSAFYAMGWLEEMNVNGITYLRVKQGEGLLAIKNLGSAYMDRISGMKNSAEWVRWVLEHKDNLRLRSMLEPLPMEDAECIIRLAILLSEGNYRVYSWKYQHLQQLYLMAVDAEHRKPAYVIAIGDGKGCPKSEMYLNLRHKIRRLPAYRWVQEEEKLVELTLVLFTNE